VLEEADVPELRFATGKFPATLLAALTKVVAVLFVPPLPVGKVPVTSVVKFIVSPKAARLIVVSVILSVS
jgi:hypothetical protein